MALTLALRRALAAPGFTLGVLLTVALVVTVNASAFAGWWALLYKPLAFDQAERWTELRIDLRDINIQVDLSPSLYAAARDAKGTFDAAIGASAPGPTQLDELARPWRLQRISADFTQMLGVAPARGRALGAAGEDERALLLSDRVWRERFGASADALGRRLRIGRSEYQIVGVMPPGFAWPDAGVQAWTPWLPTAAEREQDAQGGFGQFQVAARLAPGVGLAQAQQTLAALFATSNTPMLRIGGERVRADVRPWRERYSAGHLSALLLLQAAAALLLLVAAANLSGLMLDRMWSHRRALAIRQALGASSGALLRLTLADLLMPTIVGGALAIALTPLAIAALQARGLLPAALPVTVGGDAPTWLVALTCALLVVAVSAAAALLALRRFARAGSLNQRVSVHGLGRLQTLALIIQIALTTALAGGAGLLLRSATNLANEARGFDPHGVLMTQIELPAAERPADRAANDDARTIARVQAALTAIPGVEQVAVASMPPFASAEFVTSVQVPGVSEPVQVRAPEIGAGYFDALHTPLLAGRDFSAEEIAAGGVAIVDAAFQQRWLHPSEVIGSTLHVVEEGTPGRDLRVVGVVAASKQRALDETDVLPAVYTPLAGGYGGAFLLTRTALDPAPLVEQVRRAVAAAAPDASLVLNLPLADAVARTLQSRQALLESVTLFGIATLLLAALGLYALLNAAVSRRSAEFGVRMALGGRASRILLRVLREGSTLIGIGVAVGVVLGLSCSGLLAERLHRLAPTDAWTWTCTVLAVFGVGLLACCLPAYRATRIPPRVALEAATS